MQESYEFFKTIMEENTGGHEVDIFYGEPQSRFPTPRIFCYRDYPTEGIPYPLVSYTRGLDGRIDDPEAGWKGRACGTRTASTRSSSPRFRTRTWGRCS